MDLPSLANFTGQSSELSSKLGGNSKTTVDVIGYINCFKKKLELLSPHLKMNYLRNFPNTAGKLLKEKKCINEEEEYRGQKETFNSEFERCFQEFMRLLTSLYIHVLLIWHC
jgi:hypothetical protein